LRSRRIAFVSITVLVAFIFSILSIQNARAYYYNLGAFWKLKASASLSLASATITNASPTALTFNLAYGTVTGAYVSYCILANDTTVGNCVWVTGTLPSTWGTSTAATYTLSIWIKNASSAVSARVDTNAVQFIAPPKLATKNISGNPNASFTISFSGAIYSDLLLRFRNVQTWQVVYSSSVSAGSVVTLPSKAGLYSTELVNVVTGGVSFGQATVTKAITNWISTQKITPSTNIAPYRVWPDYSRSFGDYNGDGYVDMVYSEGATNGGSSNSPGIYLYKYNPGTGLFVFDQRLQSATPRIYGVKFVDIDGDGWLDLVYAVNNTTTTYTTSLCYMMNTAGTFGAPTCLPVSGGSSTNQINSTDLVVADLNFDGKPDVIVVGGVYGASAWLNDRIAVYTNTGSGFSLTTDLRPVDTVDELTQVRIMDIDDTGRPAIVTVQGNNITGSKLLVFPQADDGSYSLSTLRSTTTSQASLFTWGYLNGDTKPDLVMNSQGGSTGGFYIQSNAADTTLALTTMTAPTEQYCGVNSVADVDLTGTPKLYMSPKNRLLYNNLSGIYFQTIASLGPAPTVSSANSIPGQTTWASFQEASFDFVDLNGDGTLDIMLADLYPNTIQFETIMGGTAPKLAFSVNPSGSGTPNSALAIQPTVQVQTSGGSLISTSTSAITLASYSDSGCTTLATGTLSATTNPVSAVGGVATFAGVKHSVAETIYIKASASGYLSACSSAVNIYANKLVFSTQPSNTASPNTNFPTQPVGTATDSITLAPYLDSACTTPATGTLSATTNPLAATAGVATFAGVKHSVSERIFIRANAPGLAFACSSGTMVGTPTNKLVFATQPSSLVKPATVFGTSPAIELQNQGGTLLTSATDSITLAAYSDSGCTTPAAGTLTASSNPLAAVSGVATFAGVQHSLSEMIYIKASHYAYVSACSSVVNVYAPPTFDQTIGANNAGGAATYTISATTGGTNRLLLLAVTWKSNGAMSTVPTGGAPTWVSLGSVVQGTGLTLEVFRGFATSTLSASVVTITVPGGVKSSATLVSYSGTDLTGTNGSGAIDAVNTATAASGTNPSTSVTPVSSSVYTSVVGFMGNGFSTAPSAGTGFTLQTSSSSTGGALTSRTTSAVETMNSSATGGGAVTVPWTQGTIDWVESNIAIKGP
jgi:hypothetical protein